MLSYSDNKFFFREEGDLKLPPRICKESTLGGKFLKNHNKFPLQNQGLPPKTAKKHNHIHLQDQKLPLDHIKSMHSSRIFFVKPWPKLSKSQKLPPNYLKNTSSAVNHPKLDTKIPRKIKIYRLNQSKNSSPAVILPKSATKFSCKTKKYRLSPQKLLP